MEPSFVFVNGPVFTADASRPWARGLAVAGPAITAVGGEAEALSVVGRGTEVIDLAGRMLLPGFGDAHVHPVHGGLARLRCDLLELSGRDEALVEISRFAAATSDEGWILGRGWAFEWFEVGCPSAELLDVLVGEKPAYLVVRDGHSGWANSRALALAGITASTPDPVDGRIERLDNGTPQGTLHEGAMELVQRVIPLDTDLDLDRGLDEGQAHLHSLGITSWQDAWVDPRYHAAYLRADESGRLRSSVRAALWWDRKRDHSQLDELVERRSQARGLYDPGSVKLMLDGVCENFTASMLEPYERDRGRGIDFISTEELTEIVPSLDALGFQCHFHAIGDAAVRSALDAVEAARAANGWHDRRHTIAHIQVVHPDDVPRFRQLGVVANIQALWACNEPAMTELTIPFLGRERSRWQYPFGELERAGIALAMGSDWPVTSANPLEQVSVAVRRLPIDGSSDEVFLPDQRLSLHRALTAFTAGSAYVNHLESGRRTLRPGNVADLIILASDPFTSEALEGVQVDMTVVSGKIVYGR